MNRYFTNLFSTFLLLLFVVAAPVLAILVPALAIALCLIAILAFWVFKVFQAFIYTVMAVFGKEMW